MQETSTKSTNAKLTRAFYITTVTFVLNGKVAWSKNGEIRYGKIPDEYSTKIGTIDDLEKHAKTLGFSVWKHKRLFGGEETTSIYFNGTKYTKKNFTGGVKTVKSERVFPSVTFEWLMKNLPHDQFANYIKDTYRTTQTRLLKG